MAITDLDTHVSTYHSILDNVLSLDQSLMLWLNQKISNSFFDWFFPSITDLHKTNAFKYGFLPLVLIFFLYKFGKKSLIFFAGLVLSIGLSDWLGSQLKHLFVRPRPFETFHEVIQRSAAGGYSFPSNHASNMFCAAMFFSIFFPNTKTYMFVIAFLVAFSRVYNGVHYPIDVFVGAVLGIFVGGTVAWIMKKVDNIIANRKFERGIDG